MVMDVVFHRLHPALARTIEAGFFFPVNIFTRLLFLAVQLKVKTVETFCTKPLAHICIQELTSLFLLIRIVQRLNSLYLLPALNPVSYSEEMICDVVVKAGVEGSSDTHMEGNCHRSVVSCFLCIVDIFHICLPPVHSGTRWWRPLSLELICLTRFSPLLTKK